MHAERDHLVTVVFPELRERVEELGLELYDVDLRWGVPAKNIDGETANSWEYCQKWIDRVEPFFICMLGQRYGWVPQPTHFRTAIDRERQAREPRSITELEARHAFLDGRRKRRSYFYLRTTLVPEPNDEFVDSTDRQEKLEKLKIEIRECDRPVRNYSPEWNGKEFIGLDKFGELVLEDLWSGVLRDERYVSKAVWRKVLDGDPDSDRRYTDESKPVSSDLRKQIVNLAKPPPKDPLDAERDQMSAFAASRLRWFQGRDRELNQLTDFIESNAENAPRVAIVAAGPGQGKSSLLAKFSSLAEKNSNLVISHFVGASDRSATASLLVQRLVDELDRSDIEWPNELNTDQKPKRDHSSLSLRLRQLLGSYSGKRKIVLIVDALNQLTDGHDLNWLPVELGSSVRLIVSCGVSSRNSLTSTSREDDRIITALDRFRNRSLSVVLAPLAVADVRRIVVDYLEEYCKELDEEYVDAICTLNQAKNPLYLLVLLGELRMLGGKDMNQIVGERILNLPRDYPDSEALFHWVLKRLKVFGSDVVKWWCLYLAAGREGMNSQEMINLLSRKFGDGSVLAANRIQRGLRGYLQRRGKQFDFFPWPTAIGGNPV